MDSMKKYPHIIAIEYVIDGVSNVICKSVLTGRICQEELPAEESEIRDWMVSTETIQDALPGLSPDQREFLLMGCTQSEVEYIREKYKGFNWDLVCEEDDA